MYTGITQGCFPIVSTEKHAGYLRYQIRLPLHLAKQLDLGASIAVDGVCQTVVNIQPCPSMADHLLITFDAMTETLNKTTLNTLHVGRLVSIERSLRFGDEIGGHLLSGHVHGVGTIVSLVDSPVRYSLSIQVPKQWCAYILPKGFIAIDGSSLTVVDIDTKHATFSVHLIPETRKRTGLGNCQIGDKVNIELCQQTCTIVDTVKRVLADHSLIDQPL